MMSRVTSGRDDSWRSTSATCSSHSTCKLYIFQCYGNRIDFSFPFFRNFQKFRAIVPNFFFFSFFFLLLLKKKQRREIKGRSGKSWQNSDPNCGWMDDKSINVFLRGSNVLSRKLCVKLVKAKCLFYRVCDNASNVNQANSIRRDFGTIVKVVQ